MLASMVCWKDVQTQGKASSTVFVQSAVSTPSTAARGPRSRTEDDVSAGPRPAMMSRTPTEEQDVLEVHELKSDSGPCCSLWTLLGGDTPLDRTRCDSDALGVAATPSSEGPAQNTSQQEFVQRVESGLLDDAWPEPQDDCYDPRLPEYVQTIPREEVAASNSRLLARQMRALKQALEWRQAPGRITPGIKRHYERVVADMRGRNPPLRLPEPKDRFSSDEEGEERGSEFWERGSEESKARHGFLPQAMNRWKNGPHRPGEYFADAGEDDIQTCAEASSSRSRPTPQAEGDNATSPAASRASDLHNSSAGGKDGLNQTSSAGSLQISVRDDDEWVITQTVDWSSEHSSHDMELGGSGAAKSDKSPGDASANASSPEAALPRVPSAPTPADVMSQPASPVGALQLIDGMDTIGEKQRSIAKGNSMFSDAALGSDAELTSKKRRAMAKGESMVDICAFAATHEDEDPEEAEDINPRGSAAAHHSLIEEVASPAQSPVQLPQSTSQSPAYQQLPHSASQSPVRLPHSASQSPASLGGALSGSSCGEFGSCRELESCYERNVGVHEVAHTADLEGNVAELVGADWHSQHAFDQQYLPTLPESDTSNDNLASMTHVASSIKTRQRSVAGGESMFDLVGYDAANRPKYCEDESTVSAGSGFSSNLTAQDSTACYLRAPTLSTDDSEHRINESEQQSELSDRLGVKSPTTVLS